MPFIECVSLRLAIWAHNSHLGDSTASHRGGFNFERNDTWNVGQMIRATFGMDKVRILGFYTYYGYLRASEAWDTPSKRFKLQPAIKYSSEWFLHEVSTGRELPQLFLNLRPLGIQGIHDEGNISVRLPATYRNLLPKNKVTKDLDSKSRQVKELDVDETFEAVERKVTTKGAEVRVKLRNGGWITTDFRFGSVRKRAKPAAALYPEDPATFFNTMRLQRWVGVNYKPDTELQSHYGETCLGRQYDGVIFIDHTNELRPIRKNLTKYRGISRLKHEYKNLLRNPVQNVTAIPSEENVFDWYFVFELTEQPYAGGIYMGMLKFPNDFPLKPPKIIMITPNGRFKTNMPICLSMSSYHPELWNPTWTVESILIGLYSFWLEGCSTTGSVDMSAAQRKRLAKNSLGFNKSNKKFMDMFSELLDEDYRKKRRAQEEEASKSKFACRYCLKGDDLENLVAPCKCDGSSKYCHLQCLKDWQKSVLINQSTNPRYQTDIDKKCNVCLQEFTVKPVDRFEQMLHYTGPELARTVARGNFIISEGRHSAKTDKLIKKHSDRPSIVANFRHWTYGVFLITKVQEYDSRDDTVIGVNLTREMTEIPEHIVGGRFKIPLRKVWNRAYGKIFKKKMDFHFFIGGPCQPEQAYAVSILENVTIADIERRSAVSVVLSDAGKTVISGELKEVVTAVEKLWTGMEKPLVMVFSGYAGWSRTQLLGEISRRHWMLCRTQIADVKVDPNLWRYLHDSGRCIVARHTEFSAKEEDDSD